jgi:hypothetical protein
MKSIFSFVAFCALVVSTNFVHAGVFGSAYQRITGARIQVSANGVNGWTNAVDGVDFLVLASGSSSSTFATMTGFAPDVNFSASTLDAQVAYSGPGAGPANNTSFAAGAAGVQPAGTLLSYASSDTAPIGAGDLLTAPGAGVELTSSAGINGIGLFGTTITNSTLNATVNTTIQALANAFYRIEFQYLVNLTTDVTPPGGIAIATSTWTVFTSGNAPGNNVNNFQSPTPLNQTAMGGLDYLNSGTLATNGVKLFVGGQYSIAINGSTSVTVQTVPEPSSILIIGMLGSVAAVGFRRRLIK